MKRLKLQTARKNSGLTQKEIAKQANISVISYQRIEYGKQTPSINTAFLIARALNSTVDELFGN